ncbi:DMT family transporter [Campylobacter sp. Cr9]|uniref:DMT family transporter n=1 Tax=Campylobacter sp. Cr9 TaxID=2735728 RepID=UPI003014AF58|nr:DMT family transporter [Campylobacter sp. Cr9]
MKKIIRKNLGIYFMVIASFAFALMGCSAKLLANDMPSVEIMFFRNVIGVIFIAYLIYKIPHKKSGGKFFLLFFRGLIGTISLYFFFYNVANISLGGAFAFQKTNPLFVALIAFLFFKEQLGIKSILYLFLAFSGVMLIIQPLAPEHLHTGFDIKNSILGVLSGLTAALALTSARELGKYYNTEVIASSFFILGTILPIISMLGGEYLDPDLIKHFDFAFAKFVMPNDFKLWILIILMGSLSIVYQIYVTKAYKAAKKAGVVAGVGYIDVVFTLLLGILLGDDLPSLMVLAGIICVLIGGIGISLSKDNKK